MFLGKCFSRKFFLNKYEQRNRIFKSHKVTTEMRKSVSKCETLLLTTYFKNQQKLYFHTTNELFACFLINSCHFFDWYVWHNRWWKILNIRLNNKPVAMKTTRLTSGHDIMFPDKFCKSDPIFVKDTNELEKINFGHNLEKTWKFELKKICDLFWWIKIEISWPSFHGCSIKVFLTNLFVFYTWNFTNSDAVKWKIIFQTLPYLGMATQAKIQNCMR